MKAKILYLAHREFLSANLTGNKMRSGEFDLDHDSCILFIYLFIVSLASFLW